MEEGVRTTIDGLLGQGRFDEFSTSVRARIMENAQELRAEYLSPGLYSEFTCDDAKKIKVPVLLLTGKLSTKIYRYGVKELQRCIPGAECSVIPKSSHAMHLDNPDAFNARILNFLSRH